MNDLLVRTDWQIGKTVFTSSGSGPFIVKQQNKLTEMNGETFTHYGEIFEQGLIFECHDALWVLSKESAIKALRDYCEGKTVDLKRYGRIIGAVTCRFGSVSIQEARRTIEAIESFVKKPSGSSEGPEKKKDGMGSPCCQ